MRELLRGLPVLAQHCPGFDPDAAPANPLDLLASWLRQAIAAEVSEPHAVTLATVDADGSPDLRVLILKDLDEHGLYVASESVSAKGAQLAANPRAAIGFYWREQGRQIRVRGLARPAGREVSVRDFLARPLGSRTVGLIGRQSAVLHDPADLDAALADAEARLAADPHQVAEHHTVYLIEPVSVEFWQADAQRRHIRLRYRRDGDGWRTERLWP